MNKIIVYPYSILFAPFLRHLSNLQKYEIIGAVMPGKLIKEEVDASFVDEGLKMNVPILTDFESRLNECDTVLWAEYDYDENESFYNKVLYQINYALDMGLNIICCQELSETIIESFKTKARKNNCEFKYIMDINDNFNDLQDYNGNVTVPVITVMGVTENCSKFETQLSISRIFKEKGYKVAQIGSRQACELLNIHSFPKFMINNQFSEIKKIELFRKYLIKLQSEENPDLIIVGIPGGIIPFNDKEKMHYGIFAYEIFNAIDSDYNIVNSWVDTYKNICKDLEKIVYYRYNTHIDAICLSNISVFNDHSIIDRQSLEYNVYNIKKIEDCIQNVDYNSIYNVLDESSMNRLVDNIINKLTN